MTEETTIEAVKQSAESTARAVADSVGYAAHAVADTLKGAAGALAGHGGHAAGAGHEETVDIVHHLTELHAWETPLGKLNLDPFQYNLFGVDMSITKPVIFMWIAGLILLLVLTLPFRGGRLLRNKFAHLVEVYILFIRDEVVYPAIGEKDGRPLLPFFLTVFFFILTQNLLGLVPWGSTATANVNVTAGLAIVAFIMIQGMGIVKHGFFRHWKNMIPSGIPVFVIPIMIPIELIGMVAKPFALCIRLFANMVAGHAVILVLLSLILMGKSYILAPFPLFGVVFISLMEILIAHIQAFIFTILTALFVSMTMHPEH